jgi:hypothetical protein
MSGTKIAASHTQEEWETIGEEGKLEDEIKTICPNVKDVKDKYLPHLLKFFYQYGSDSGNVPSC